MMRAREWVPRLIATVLIAAYLLFMPAYLNDALKERTYDEKFSPTEEPYTGIISVWHIVGFKPYSGSMSTALAAIAKGIERRHHGVFFDVIAMDETEYTERLARGESPDLLSFPLGVCYPDQLSAFDELPVECISKDMAAVGEWDGKSYALPYAMSAHALIVNTGLFQERGAMVPEGTRNAAWILQAAETFAAAQKSGKAPKKSGTDWRWIITIFIITVCISAVMSLISTNLLANATLGVSFVILICIIAIGIVFDIIGVAVTAADEKPFHSMASRKVPEAGEALKLIRNAGRVSSFCNDVIGDICGVISGSAAAVISARVLLLSKSGSEIFITLLLSAVVSGMTVGGKACGKSLAMNSSTAVVRTAAKVLCFFRTLPQRLEKKSAKK